MKTAEEILERITQLRTGTVETVQERTAETFKLIEDYALDAKQAGFKIGKKWAAELVIPSPPRKVIAHYHLVNKKQAILSDQTTLDQAEEQLNDPTRTTN